MRARTHRLLGLLAALVLVLVGCGHARVVQRESRPLQRDGSVRPLAGRGEYVVARGDTLYGIAFRNGMDFRELAAINGIDAPYTIYVNQLLRLRGGHARPPVARPVASAPQLNTSPSPSTRSSTPSTSIRDVRVEQLPDSRPGSAIIERPRASSLPPDSAATTSMPSRPPAASTLIAAPTATPALSTPASAAVIPSVIAPIGGLGWRWPTSGNVISRFMAGDATRQGLDIAGNAGDPVLAAADGVVVYSGSGLVGYGELIIIKHSDEWLSAYGHNRKRLVNEGQRVKAGQQIAEMGRSGASRDMLHFEIRRNGRPVDPLQFMPAR